MEKQVVAAFRPYDFDLDQKIHIESGPRKGDWKVVGVNDRKVKVQCPISLKTYEWDRFCYFVEERRNVEWPRKDED